MDILHDIDQINWRRLKHSYGNGGDVPELLRRLLYADVQDWDNSFWHLINTIHHQNDVMSATTATIPYLIRYIDYCPVEKLEGFIWTLEIIANTCLYSFPLPQQSLYFDDHVDTFRNLSKGYPSYLRLLSYQLPEVRYAAALLLRHLTQHRNVIRIHLWHALREEENAYVSWSLFQCLARHLLIERYSRSRLLKQYRAMFEAIWQSHKEPLVRLGAATAWLQVRDKMSDAQVPRAVIDLIVISLAGAIDPQLPSAVYFPSVYTANDSIHDLTIKELSIALDSPHLTNEIAHKIVREMLDRTFPRIQGNDPKLPTHLHDANWNIYLKNVEDTDEFIYSHNPDYLVFPDFGSRRLETRIFVLETVIACDLFWRIPTNLLSFFFGLPTDRTELLDHMHKMKTHHSG